MAKSDSEVTKTLVVGLVIGLVLGGAIGYLASSMNRGPSDVLSNEEARARAEDFINENLLQPGIEAKVESVTERSGVYVLVISVSDGSRTQRLNSSISRDGRLFFPDVIDLAAVPQKSRTEVDMKELIDDDPWEGGRDATVVIVEFSDFQCSFCARAALTVKQIKENYGDKILFVYRDFPLTSIHPEAQKAAEAAQCAYEQGSFWEYHDILFEKQVEWGGVGSPKFMEYAANMGLDTEQFNDCLSSGKYSEEVSKDLQDGARAGVTGTPAFFVNTKMLSGAQPFSVFQKTIDEELAKTG